MENSKISLRIPCPVHPSEEIQRVDMNFYAPQQFYCVECIFSQKSTSTFSSNSNLQTIPALIDFAVVHYTQKKNSIRKLGEQAPSEYLDLFNGKGEKLERLSKHIEDEKKKVCQLFDTLMQDMINIVSEKKNECLNKLDQQLVNLRYSYIFFEKQLKKTYPTEEDIPFLFPSREELMTKLEKITDATQLAVFVRNIKEDLRDKKLGTEKGIEGDIYLKSLCDRFKKWGNVKPHFEQVNDMEISIFKSEIQKSFEAFMKNSLKLEDQIEDVIIGVNLDSKFLEPDQIVFLRESLPESLRFSSPKPVYRASRDGFDAKDFHEKCDGLKHTMSIIKCIFKGAERSSVIGGYLDEAWQSAGVYIPSSNAFIFSLTTKVKCPISNMEYAGVGTREYGPCFGGGYDIRVQMDSEASCMTPHSYEGASKLVEAPNYAGSGGINFKVEDIEVYTLVDY